MKSIDLNCDLGEGWGWDDQIIPLVSSVNIACGGHAGDKTIMVQILGLLRGGVVAAGAHPSYMDREHFGRRELTLPADKITALVRSQVETLLAVAKAQGVELDHVKPHGALYNQAARDVGIARAVAAGVAAISPKLRIYTPPDSALAKAAVEQGLAVWLEAYADRRYGDDGSLVPRSHPLGVIEDVEAAAEQALSIVADGSVRTVSGQWIKLHADTLCVHGDGPDAPALARAVRTRLEAAGVRIGRAVAAV